MAEWEHSAQGLTPLLLYKLRAASIVAALAEQGVPEGDIPRESGLNPWVVRTQMLPLARQLGPAGIRRALRARIRVSSAMVLRVFRWGLRAMGLMTPCLV